MIAIGCNSEEMHNNLEQLTTLTDEQYSCDIESSCNLHRKKNIQRERNFPITTATTMTVRIMVKMETVMSTKERMKRKMVL